MPDASLVCVRPREPGVQHVYARLPAPAKGSAGKYARVPEDGLRAGKHRASRIARARVRAGEWVGSPVRVRARVREARRALPSTRTFRTSTRATPAREGVRSHAEDRTT